MDMTDPSLMEKTQFENTVSLDCNLLATKTDKSQDFVNNEQILLLDNSPKLKIIQNLPEQESLDLTSLEEGHYTLVKKLLIYKYLFQ